MLDYFLVSILATITSILLLIFASFLVFQSKRRNKSGILLSAFLTSNALFLMKFICTFFPNIPEDLMHWIAGFSFTFGFVFGPLLYLFSSSITNRGFQFHSNQLWHFLVFGITLTLFLSEVQMSFHFVLPILIIHINAYLYFSFKDIKKYRGKIKQIHSYIDNIQLNWLIYLLGGFSLMWLLDLVALVMVMFRFSSPNLLVALSTASVTINFIFAVMIFYKALQQPEFLINVLKELNAIKYKDSKLSEFKKKEILSKILDHFKNEQPYLNPDLKIKDIGDFTGTPTKYISQVINDCAGKNFYDFVNFYRIKLAEHHLFLEKDKTILEILYASGFNSKSAFNTAFKKQIGMTPSEYRRQHQPTPKFFTTNVIKPS